MSKATYLKFYSKGKEGRELSNFSELSVIINGILYKTGEHAFQGSKYLSASVLYDEKSKRHKKLIEYGKKFQGDTSEFETALDAKRGGSKTKFKLVDKEIELWNKDSINIQKQINNYKYDNYPIIKTILDKYANSVLIHQDNRADKSTIWGARITKDNDMIGNNVLGKMWEELRNDKKELDKPEPSKPSEEPEPEPSEQEPEPEPSEQEPEPEPSKPSEEPEPEPSEQEPEPVIVKQPIEIMDDIELEENITYVEMPAMKQDNEKEKKKKISIYNKNIIEKRVSLHISELGSNVTEVLERKTKNEYENICTNDGYIKKDSIELITYSCGFVENANVLFDVVFDALVFKPVEGMIIYNCIVDNISRAGIKARTNEEISPAIIFIAKDHAYKNAYYNTINENDTINIKVIGHRYELKDSKISIIASLVEKRNIKIVLNKR